MKALLIMGMLFASSEILAQKNVAPVTNVTSIQLNLPPGSKQDKRMLSVTSAKILLEEESKKAGTSIKNTEVYLLPPATTSFFNADSLVQQLSKTGWNISSIVGDTKFSWIQQSGKHFLLFFEMDKKYTNLYLAESVAPPAGKQQPTSSGNVPTTAVAQPYQQKSAGIQQQQQTTLVTQEQPSNEPPVISNNSCGISKSTTNFSDGWVANAGEDFVVLGNNNCRVLLHYGQPVEQDIRGADEDKFTAHFWNKLSAGRYTTAALWYRPADQFKSFPVYYAEATAIEKKTGKNVFVAFYILVESGVSFCVEAIAQSKEAYQQQFPHLNALATMRNANRFAISREDIPGEWGSSGGSLLQYYNVYTGLDAGSTFSSGGRDFTFKPSGTYSARYVGGMGNMGGSQVIYDKKYNGQFSLTDWEITLTKHTEDPTIFLCHYEAVKGGRILHLTNKTATGIQYNLVKIK